MPAHKACDSVSPLQRLPAQFWFFVLLLVLPHAVPVHDLDFSPTLACLLEHLSIEEPEAREWTMMAAINIGTLLEYGRPQGVLRRADVLSQLDQHPAAAATTKVKLARKAHTDEKMEVNGDECQWSSDIEALNAQCPSTDATASQEPPFAFKMAQELIFLMLACALQSMRDGPNFYVTILLTFLLTILQKLEGLAALEHAIPWMRISFSGAPPWMTLY
jgi:protein SMG6